MRISNKYNTLTGEVALNKTKTLKTRKNTQQTILGLVTDLLLKTNI